MSSPVTPTFSFSLDYYDPLNLPAHTPFYSVTLEPPTYRIPLLRLGPPILPHRILFILHAGSPILPEASLVISPFLSGFDEKEASSNAFQEIPFDYNCINHATAEITLTSPGPYTYFVRSPKLQKPTESGCILMDPRLEVGGHVLPNLDAIILQTVVPKWLGPLRTWLQHFKFIRELGFNMIHFVPMQQRGSSNSPYSLSDPLEFSSDLFDDPGVGPSREEKEIRVAAFLKELHTTGLLSMTDVVWNHTSHDSPWLRTHPECGYNLVNSPHLLPAYELDSAILAFTLELEPKWNLPRILTSDDQLQNMLKVFRHGPFQDLKLWEYFVLDVPSLVRAFSNAIRNIRHTLSNANPVHTNSTLHLLSQKDSQRLNSEAHAQLLKDHAFVELAPFGHMRFAKSMDLDRSLAFFHPEMPPSEAVAEYEALLNTLNMEFYRAYDALVLRVFQNLETSIRWHRLDAKGPRVGAFTASRPMVDMYFTRGDVRDPARVWANNGWIWNGDPSVDFASAASTAYLQRDVIVWGDCVKLRYGDSPDACPWLWAFMRTYTCTLARLFHGFRIDNCHSTPLHVAKYLLAHARAINPHLYVIAELFTGDPALDQRYVTELGIHSLIREAMQAWDARELSRLIHIYSGDPIGSFRPVLVPGKPIPLKPKEPHAILMDCTHDNDPPSVKRQTCDTLPNAALVSFARCAVGSVTGYDICIPEHLNIVSEKRKYPPFSMDMGIHQLRKTLSDMNECMVNMNEIYVHHDDPYIMVSRQNPVTHEGITLIALPAFKHSQPGSLHPVVLSRSEGQLCLAQRLDMVDLPSLPSPPPPSSSSSSQIEGVPVRLTDISHKIRFETQGADKILHVSANTLPGSMFVIQTRLTGSSYLRPLHALHNGPPADLLDACRTLSLFELGDLLFRCAGETELGVYTVPGYGALPYCGLEGTAGVLRSVVHANDLGHPLCSNLREGPWLLDYTVDRLSASPVKAWLHATFTLVKLLPNYLVPKYFALVLLCATHAARDVCWEKMKHAWRFEPSFVCKLALTSIQLVAMPPGVSLHPTLPMPSLAAGLPHFSLGYMRCWGRDIFISLKGLFLLTGQFELAKSHLLAFAQVLRHGLIPNLLDSGREPRYNARDAVWWFMNSVQAYVETAPEGNAFLFTTLRRRFPDDTWVPPEHPSSGQRTCTVWQVLLEIFERHANGISFVEWKAGSALDHAMTPQGFHVEIRMDPATGFVHGGNAWNCGTWMDKMGDYGDVAGVPATPRDGAPIELTALLYKALCWVHTLYTRQVVPEPGVWHVASGTLLTWEQWAQKICAAFEPAYYMGAGESYVSGMYRDVVGATRKASERQFRPNQFLAMALAPALFEREHALAALAHGQTLLGPLGIKTLHPLDPQYRPHYDPGHAGPDPALAHGYNYHQGPEWVWPVGYYFLAYLHFHGPEDIHFLQSKLSHLSRHITVSRWAGLPELTNENGAPCKGSCETQAWSMATLLELAHVMHEKAYLLKKT